MSIKRLVFSFGFSAVIVFLTTVTTRSVGLSETPVAVQKTINAQVGDGKLEEIDRTNDDDEVTFDVSFATKTGVEQGFTVADDGTVLSVEVELTETPDAVQKAIREQSAGWQLNDINKNVADTEISYEAELSKNGHDKSFTVNEGGVLQDEEVSLTETPSAVQTAITAQVAAGHVKSIDENFDPDGNSFDIEAVTPEGGRNSFSVAVDGTLLSREVSLGKVPPAARKAIRERISGGKLIRIDKSLNEQTDRAQSYDVQGRKNGLPFNFSVNPRGKFLGMDD